MKPLRLKTVLLSLAAIMVVFVGCSQKKPVLVVPRERPISGAPTPTPTPEAQQSTAASTPQPTPEATPSIPDQAQVTPPKKKHHISKPSPSVKSNPETGSAQGNPRKPETTTEAKANPEPKATPGLISPAISASDAARDQSATDQLLQSTETNLNSIGKRQLTSDEQSVVSQIKNFITQSRQALKDNDPARARNLALKANLLSNDLTKSR